MIKTDFKLSQNEENVQLIEIDEIEEIYDESNIDLLRDENTPIAIIKAEEYLKNDFDNTYNLAFINHKISIKTELNYYLFK